MIVLHSFHKFSDNKLFYRTRVEFHISASQKRLEGMTVGKTLWCHSSFQHLRLCSSWWQWTPAWVATKTKVTQLVGHTWCDCHSTNCLSFRSQVLSTFLHYRGFHVESCTGLRGQVFAVSQSVSACAQKPLYLLPLAECQAANCTDRATCDAINSKSVIQSLKIWEFSKFVLINQLQTIYILHCSGLLSCWILSPFLHLSPSFYPANYVRTAGCPADCGQRLWKRKKVEEGKSLNVTRITGYPEIGCGKTPAHGLQRGPLKSDVALKHLSVKLYKRKILFTLAWVYVRIAHTNVNKIIKKDFNEETNAQVWWQRE